MSAWVGAAAVIGAGSLGGFAIGALMSGSCVLAVTARREAGGREGNGAGAYRSRHRRGGPLPGSAPRRDAVRQGGARPDGAHPDGGLPDGTFGDRTFGSPRRPPRHAAPSVSFASRMSGLFVPRALASGARG